MVLSSRVFLSQCGHKSLRHWINGESSKFFGPIGIAFRLMQIELGRLRYSSVGRRNAVINGKKKLRAAAVLLLAWGAIQTDVFGLGLPQSRAPTARYKAA
jgi:hypothetical protein